MRCHVVSATVAFALVLPLFNRLIESGDHPGHIQFALDLALGKSMPPHPLFHALLFALTGDHASAAPGMAALLLALAIAARAWLTTDVLMAEANRLAPLTVLVLCICLGLALPLPNWWGGDLVIGQPSSNVWHSPTFLLAVPFALWLFGLATQLIDQPGARLAALTGIAMALSLLAKPNYVLAFAPCFGPAALVSVWRAWREGRLQVVEALAVLALTFGPAVAVMARQALWLQTTHPVFLCPFVVWQQHSRHILASIVLGTAFPLAAVICYPLRANADRTLMLAWSTLAVAIATFALLAETSGGDANWGWGCHLATAVLFVISTTFVLRQPADWRRVACLSVLACHAASGAVFLGHCIERGRF
jgi:hypothetical protein